jgi:hypothetical protein
LGSIEIDEGSRDKKKQKLPAPPAVEKITGN